MNFKPAYIVRLAMAILILLLLAVASVMAQRTVYEGTRTKLEVEHLKGDTYQWELYSDPNVNFALVNGNCPHASARFIGNNTGPAVEVEWLLPGIYFYKVTALSASECTNNLKLGMIKVIPYEVQAIIAGAAQSGVCQQFTLDGSASKGELLSYQWSVLDPGVALTSQNTVNTSLMLTPGYTGALPADFRVKLRVTNKDGKSDSDTISIKVDPLPVADIYSNNQPEKDGSMIVDGSVSRGTALSYKWTTSEGKIVGPIDRPTANLIGAGIYNLEVVDNNGCKSTKSFKFPLELFQIIANPDYARTSWAQDTTVFVLSNDHSSVDLIPGTVRVIQPPSRGQTRVNPDGTVTYTPTGRLPGRDHFVYEVCDALSQCDSALVTIDIYAAGLKIPEAFSPNGDGLNEHLVFKGLENYPKSRIHIYTRSGQLVYESDDYLNDWDGRTFKSTLSNLELVPTGVYYYVLELGGVNRTIKGFVYIAY